MRTLDRQPSVWGDDTRHSPKCSVSLSSTPGVPGGPALEDAWLCARKACQPP